MRSSTIVTLACAGLAAASPLMRKAFVTDIVTSTIVVYVTVDDEPTSAPPAPTVALPTTTELPVVVVPTTTETPVVVTPIPTAEPPVVVSPAPEPPVETPAFTLEITTPIVQVEASGSVDTSTNVKGGTTPGSTNAGSAANGCALTTPTDYASTAVFWHNIHRCNHSAPALTWSDSLAKSASILAATCVFAHDVSINGGGYGQNIASFGTTASPQSYTASTEVAAAVSEMWYNGELPLYEASNYGQDNPDFSNFEGWGHFSQIVWKSTTEVGCASQYCSAGGLFSSMGGWYTVCNYGSAGNMGGQYGANVLPPLGHASVKAP